MFLGLFKNYNPNIDKRPIRAKQKREKKIDNKLKNQSNLKTKSIKMRVKTHTLFHLKETKAMNQIFFRKWKINHR